MTWLIILAAVSGHDWQSYWIFRPLFKSKPFVIKSYDLSWSKYISRWKYCKPLTNRSWVWETLILAFRSLFRGRYFENRIRKAWHPIFAGDNRICYIDIRYSSKLFVFGKLRHYKEQRISSFDIINFVGQNHWPSWILSTWMLTKHFPII